MIGRLLGQGREEVIGAAKAKEIVEDLCDYGDLGQSGESSDDFIRKYAERDFERYVLPEGEPYTPYMFMGCKNLKFVNATSATKLVENSVPEEEPSPSTIHEIFTTRILDRNEQTTSCTMPNFFIGGTSTIRDVSLPYTSDWSQQKGKYICYLVPEDFSDGAYTAYAGQCGYLDGASDDPTPIKHNVEFVPFGMVLGGASSLDWYETTIKMIMESYEKTREQAIEYFNAQIRDSFWETVTTLCGEVDVSDKKESACNKVQQACENHLIPCSQSRILALFVSRVLLQEEGHGDDIEWAQESTYFVDGDNLIPGKVVFTNEICERMMTEETLAEDVIAHLKKYTVLPMIWLRTSALSEVAVSSLQPISSFEDLSPYDFLCRGVKKYIMEGDTAVYMPMLTLDSKGNLILPEFEEGRFYMLPVDDNVGQ